VFDWTYVAYTLLLLCVGMMVTTGEHCFPQFGRRPATLHLYFRYVEVAGRSVSEFFASRPYDAASLWDISDSSSPLRTDLAREHIKSKLGVDQVGGVTSYAATFRDALRRRSFIAERGDIPADEVVVEPRTCQQKHRGLCPHRDGEHFGALLFATLQLQKWVFASAPIGSMVRVSCFSDGDVESHNCHVEIAHIRKARPLMVVLASCTPVGEEGGRSALQIQLNDTGLLKFQVLSEVVSELRAWILRPGVRMEVRIIAVESSLRSLSLVEVKSVGDAEIINLTAARPARVVAAEDPAEAAAAPDLPADLALAMLARNLEAGFAVMQHGQRQPQGCKKARATAKRTAGALPMPPASEDEFDVELEVVVEEMVDQEMLHQQATNKDAINKKLAGKADAGPDDHGSAEHKRKLGDDVAPAVVDGDLAKDGRGPRQKRAMDWCGFALAALKGGGWGATCKLHMNEWDTDKSCCKKSINIVGMSDDECRVRMKMWLVAGLRIDVGRSDARDAHRGVDARSIVLQEEAVVDAEMEVASGSTGGSSSTGASSAGAESSGTGASSGGDGSSSTGAGSSAGAGHIGGASSSSSGVYRPAA
jgi:hypothetical protein